MGESIAQTKLGGYEGRSIRQLSYPCGSCKNLIRPIGFWDTSVDVSDYLPTIRNALDLELKPGFMAICKLSQMKSASKKYRDEIHARAGIEVLHRSVQATVILNLESAITRMQIQYLRQKYIDQQLKVVNTLEEAYTLLRAVPVIGKMAPVI